MVRFQRYQYPTGKWVQLVQDALRCPVMLSILTLRSSLIVPALLLACLFSMAAPPPIVQGDSQNTSPPKEHYPRRPTAQTYGIDPLKGPPGTRISVTGSGFRDFTQVESITLGGADILGNRTASTDGDGNFQVDDLVVPGLDPGKVAVRIKVGSGEAETTAIGTFEVTDGAGSAGNAAPVSQALEPLGDALERVFHFENSTKEWSFFDPRPSFLDANSLAEIRVGQVYWIKVTGGLTVNLNGQQRDLTCANAGTPQQDCWNLVVW